MCEQTEGSEPRRDGRGRHPDEAHAREHAEQAVDLVHEPEERAEAVFLLVAVASYVAPVAIGFLRYGRLTSYHTRGARLAAYLGGTAALVVFAGGPALPFRLATAVLVLVELEEIAITAVLPAWHLNVPSLAHALALRGVVPGRGCSPRSRIDSRARLAAHGERRRDHPGNGPGGHAVQPDERTRCEADQRRLLAAGEELRGEPGEVRQVADQHRVPGER